MKIRKILFLLVAAVFLVTPAFAGDQPEFDAVGCDATNYFNDLVKDMVCNGNLNFNDDKINEYSDFWLVEDFNQTAGQLKDSICFGEEYQDALVDAWNSAEFEWIIVLQKKPQTDLDLNIRDCVVKHNSFTVFGENPFEGAEQTGRYSMPWGQVFWVLDANPRVTAKALRGPYHTTGFPVGGFYLDARTTPGLTTVPLVDALYTSKGVWEESIVVIMPETGVVNMSGETQYRLKQGDIIKVTITVPGNNTADIRYGADNVTIKYIGIHGTEHLDDFWCGPCGGFDQEPV